MNDLPHQGRDYGSLGRIGLAVPQANPTVEPEFAALLPARTSILVCRLASREQEPRKRFVGYLKYLSHSVATYDTLKPDILGFACTASSYLLGHNDESLIVESFEKDFGYPIVTGGQAIVAALRTLGVHQPAVLAPYPQFVIEAGERYLVEAGFNIASKMRIVTRMVDTRTIYELRSADALAGAREIDLARADCLILTGTGMPSLLAIRQLSLELKIPILSTNLCLAWAVLRKLGLPLPKGEHPLLNGWQDRIDSL